MLKRRLPVAAVVALALAAAGCGSTQVTSSSTTSWGVAMTQGGPVPGVADAYAQHLCAPDGKVVIATRSLTSSGYRPAFPTWTGDRCDPAKYEGVPYRDLPVDPGFGTPISGSAAVNGVADASSQKFCGPDGITLVVTRSKSRAGYRPAYPAWTGDPCHAGAGL